MKKKRQGQLMVLAATAVGGSVPLCIVPSYAQFVAPEVARPLRKWPFQGALVFT